MSGRYLSPEETEKNRKNKQFFRWLSLQNIPIRILLSTFLYTGIAPDRGCTIVRSA